MKKDLDVRDFIMSSNVLAGLDYSSPALADPGMLAVGMDMEAMLQRLREYPSLAMELLLTEGSYILYMGSHAGATDEHGRTLGVKFTDGGSAVKGDNIYGSFLMHVRDNLIEEMKNNRVKEELPWEGQIIVDFVPNGADMSYVESLEQDDEEEFIHVDTYKPVKYRQNYRKDGSTGFGQRNSDKGVIFQTFECPFGTEVRSHIRVGSAAEVSFFYEQALRGEMDWKAFFRSLNQRGLMKNMTEHEMSMVIADLKAQFAWMREKIIKDNHHLKQLRIVGETTLVPDNSMGRTVYDSEYAPSPAHILARYINNPHLFFSTSESAVLKALENVDKNEPYRFSAVNGKGPVTIIVDGSDTIGGRRPGTRAVKEKRPVYMRDKDGKVVYDVYGDPVVDTTVDTYKLAFKSKDEIEADYQAFSERLDNIIDNISEDVPIRFLSGKGVGTPAMLMRYVQERNGKVSEWDYISRLGVEMPYKTETSVETHRSLELLRMPGFATVLPVILDQQDRSEFIVEVEGKQKEVVFRKRDVPSPSGYISFSVKEDSRLRTTLDRAGLAMNIGLSVIHVQDNASEKTQKQSLEYGSSLSRSLVIGELGIENSIFDGDLKDKWEVKGDDVFSFVDAPSGMAFPLVGCLQDSTVYVNNIPFHSVYSAYAALLLNSTMDDSKEDLLELSKNENRMAYVSKIAEREFPDDVRERSMRNAVHMMCQASSVFADNLISSNDSEIVVRSTYGGTRDFVDIDGNGKNLFGLVLMEERGRLMKEMNDIRIKAEDEARKIAEENNRMQKRANTHRAKGEKHAAGLPGSIEESMDAVWFIGTNRPAELSLSDDQVSFIHWEERNYGKDALNRELASRMQLDDGEGGLVDNKFIFLYPTDLLAVLGTRFVKNNPDSKDLTGLTRINPETGKVFTCAYGIPVKRDNFYYERDNKLGRECSFRLDNESSDLVNSVINADALARSTAIQQDMALCYSIRERSLANGEENDDLTRVFNDKIWDYPRTKEIINRKTGKIITEAGIILPTEVKKRQYNPLTKKYESVTKEVVTKTWIDNPHAAPRNKSLIRRYQNILKEGSSFPLNCICMPKASYMDATEEQFLADFSFVLSLMNASAIAMDKPMRFPLDEDGRLFLGPDIPDKYRDMAERKLDSFIGVVKNEDLINGPLPFISRIPVASAFKNDIPLKGDGSDIYLRPNELMVTFGPYEFNKYASGNIIPMHEMAFTMDDGTVFKVTGNRFSHNLTTREANAYYRYDKNDEIRFTVKSSNPSRIPEFINILKSYVERAKRVEVEYRLVSEEDAVTNFENNMKMLLDSGYNEEQAIDRAGGTLDLDGFVNLLSSNSDSIGNSQGDVAARGPLTGVDMDRDGNDGTSVYYGKEDAKDGFKGYVEYKYTLPDGSQSSWRAIKDTELALDLVMSNINRVYRSDVRQLPSKKVLEAKLKSYSIMAAGDLFRSISQEVETKRIDTKVVGEAPKGEKIKPENKKGGNIYVTYYGNNSIPDKDYHIRMSVSCPKGLQDKMDIEFESLYPNYETMVGPHKEGLIDDAEYTRRYVENVLEPNKERILENISSLQKEAKENGIDIYLYCYCKPGNFCHRYLVNNFLNENGIICQENPRDRMKYDKGRIPLYGEADYVRVEREIEDAPCLGQNDILVFTQSTGRYNQRTYENANADDVTFTLAFATDFTTAGERATQKAAGASWIGIDLPVTDKGLDTSKKAIKEAVQSIKESLPDEFLNGEPCGFNVAGNGIYTLAKNGIQQSEVDNFVAAVLTGLRNEGMRISSLRSGGQTGVDEAVAAAGFALGVKTIIHAPNNWVFRGTDGMDVRGDEVAFKERFEKKDYNSIRNWVLKIYPQKGLKKGSERKR